MRYESLTKLRANPNGLDRTRAGTPPGPPFFHNTRAAKTHALPFFVHCHNSRAGRALRLMSLFWSQLFRSNFRKRGIYGTERQTAYADRS